MQECLLAIAVINEAPDFYEYRLFFLPDKSGVVNNPGSQFFSEKKLKFFPPLAFFTLFDIFPFVPDVQADIT